MDKHLCKLSGLFKCQSMNLGTPICFFFKFLVELFKQICTLSLPGKEFHFHSSMEKVNQLYFHFKSLSKNEIFFHWQESHICWSIYS